MNFNWKKGIGYGVLVWVVMFIVVSILLAYKMQQGTMFDIIVTVITLIAAFLLAKNIAPKSAGLAFSYGLLFAIVGILLDLLISKRFAPNIFNSIFYWVSYVLVVLVPLLAVKKQVVESPRQDFNM
jgi:hypothetical protein